MDKVFSVNNPYVKRIAWFKNKSNQNLTWLMDHVVRHTQKNSDVASGTPLETPTKKSEFRSHDWQFPSFNFFPDMQRCKQWSTEKTRIYGNIMKDKKITRSDPSINHKTPGNATDAGTEVLMTHSDVSSWTLTVRSPGTLVNARREREEQCIKHVFFQL